MPEDTKPALLVQGLRAWYGESQALHGIDLEVRRGETVALLGRNGAGKTTTLKAILGLMSRREGRIEVRGTDITRLPLHGIARTGLGYVPEERGIFSELSVAENLALPPVVLPGGWSMEEIFDLFPNLKERLNSPGTKLSGGEQQMLAMARILRTGADILLLDEPTEGLAPVIIDRIGAAIRALKARGMTVVLVEQNFRFAQKVADRYYIIENGKVRDHFGTDELASRQQALGEILGV
ncbi:MAG: ABC transporter ATP-binding protein [Gemmobacter sp.]